MSDEKTVEKNTPQGSKPAPSTGIIHPVFDVQQLGWAKPATERLATELTIRGFDDRRAVIQMSGDARIQQLSAAQMAALEVDAGKIINAQHQAKPTKSAVHAVFDLAVLNLPSAIESALASELNQRGIETVEQFGAMADADRHRVVAAALRRALLPSAKALVQSI